MMPQKISLLIIFFTFIISSCSVGPLEKTQTVETVSSFRGFSAPHGFDIFYDSGTAKTIREYHTLGSIVLNGSYFGMSPWPDGRWRGTGISIPAGLWIEKRSQKYPLRTDDPNLSHTVFVSGSIVTIQENSLSNSWIASCLAMTHCRAFQAGPLVLSGNILQDFGDSWHANEPHERTLIGVTESGKVYFFISTEIVSLIDMSKKILEGDTFKDDPITVLNLDGGPSTSYYDGQNGFREDTKLPIIFRINP